MTISQQDGSETPLVAVVFSLAYKEAFRSDKYMGRAGHSLGLAMIESINAPLSKELHDFNGINPFTTAGLFQLDSHCHWLRITALRPDIVEVVKQLATKTPFQILKHNSAQYDGWTAENILTEHDWIGETSPRQLIHDHWHPIKDITLEFKTGTAINSNGLQRPLPDPHLIFKSLWERWQRLMTVTFPCPVEADLFNTFTRDMVTVTDFQLSAESISMGKGSIPSFKGIVTYDIHNHNEALEKHDYYKRLKREHGNLSSLMNVLAHFSFYCGVGVKTAQGMGMVRPIDEQ